MSVEFLPRAQAKRWALASLGTLGLAGLGQFFLSRQDSSWGLWLGLGFFGLSVFFLSKVLPLVKTAQTGRFPSEISPWREGCLFGGIFLLAVFFRAYRLHEIPEDLFSDRGAVAYGALRILNENWRPFLDVFRLQVPDLWIYYFAAIWFKLFGTAPDVFSYFDVLLSLIGFPLLYWFFRSLSGPRIALTALFFLAVMRWNFVFARKINLEAQMLIFMGLALLLLQLALKKRKWVLFIAAGFSLAAALYSYQALKALPIFILSWFFFEYFKDPSGAKRQAGRWLVLGAVFLIALSPILYWMAQNQNLGRREKEVSILVNLQAEKSLRPLFRNTVAAAGMFNRRGDSNAQSNFNQHRMLDDVTGTIFFLAFFHALRRFREKPFFLGVSGLLVMSLPGVLSIDGAHAGRMLGTTPFTVYLCALLISDWISKAGQISRWRGGLLGSARGLAFCLFIVAAFQNYFVYFHDQAEDPDYRHDFSWVETRAARKVLSLDDKTDFFMSSRFYGHPTVSYLTYSRRERVHFLDLSEIPQPEHFPAGTNFCFLLDGMKEGTFEFLRRVYPGGLEGALAYPEGKTQLLAYFVPAKFLAGVRRGMPRVERGLYGVYTDLEGKSGKPILERWDPIINFTFRDLPSTSSALSIHWEGRFRTVSEGSYHILLLTYENNALNRGRIVIDKKTQTELVACPSLIMTLKPGWHHLDLVYEKPPGLLATVNLLWKKPGMEKFEFVPNGVWGPISRGTGKHGSQ